MITQPLRDEHNELLPHIEQLKVTADSIGSTGIEAIRQGIREVEEFLLHHLIPHAQAEDRVLYPEVERVMGAERATATMRRDHEEVGKLTGELTALNAEPADKSITDEQANRLRRVLYGLYALVQLHFDKEEEVYLPLLDARLSPDEGRALFESMEAAASDVVHGQD